MSDSDHHHELPFCLQANDSDQVMGCARSREERKAALAAIELLDEPTLQSLKKCSQALREITLAAPFHTVYQRDEDSILQLAADIHVLGQWVQTALAAFSAERRAERRLWVREFATCHSPAQPPSSALGAAPVAAPHSVSSKRPAPSNPVSAPVLPATKSLHVRKNNRPVSSAKPTPANAPAPPTPRATPQPESPSAQRLIVRYNSASSPQSRPHPSKIVQSINSALGSDALAAVSYSRDHQLVLHTKAPYTVQQLLTRDKLVRTTLNSLLYPSTNPKPTATFDTGESWAKLVLHQVPLPIWTSKSTVTQQLDLLLADLCASNGLDKSTVRRFRTLCPLDDQEKLFRASTDRAPQHVSVLLCSSDHDAASRLVRRGAIIQSAYCRASTFRTRLRRDDTAAI
ncbi:hypothetical protein AURDEDRAFT_166683 [Auricularia subglabra TFB-10046 SS5]|nr:hypothetical protein AURDEDRAFT_166683 [Auricularia subglabra TFB-10046 SS5]